MRNDLKSDTECNLAIHTTITVAICAQGCVSWHLPPKQFNTDVKTTVAANHTACVKLT